MPRIVTAALFMIAAAAIGFWVPRILQFPPDGEISLNYPGVEPPVHETFGPDEDYSCATVAQVDAADEGAKAVAGYSGGPVHSALIVTANGPQSATFRIAADGKGIFIASTTKMLAGATDSGDAIPIVFRNDDSIVASGVNELQDVETLSVSATTLKAVLSYTGRTKAGASARSLLLACHRAGT
jgi:hypothetical protein